MNECWQDARILSFNLLLKLIKKKKKKNTFVTRKDWEKLVGDSPQYLLGVYVSFKYNKYDNNKLSCVIDLLKKKNV